MSNNEVLWVCEECETQLEKCPDHDECEEGAYCSACNRCWECGYGGEETPDGNLYRYRNGRWVVVGKSIRS